MKTWSRPFGATVRIPVRRISAQSWEGKFPNAGRLIKAMAIWSDFAASRREGLLYPTGIEAI